MRTSHPDMMQQLSAMLGLAGQAQQLDSQDMQGQFDELMNPMRLQQMQQGLGHNQTMMPLVEQEAQFNAEHMQDDYDLNRRGQEARITSSLTPALMNMFQPTAPIPDIDFRRYMLQHHPEMGGQDVNSLIQQAMQEKFKQQGVSKLFDWLPQQTQPQLTH